MWFFEGFLGFWLDDPDKNTICFLLFAMAWVIADPDFVGRIFDADFTPSGWLRVGAACVIFVISYYIMAFF